MDSVKELLANTHCRVTVDLPRRLVRLTRTGAPFRDLAECDQVYLAAIRSINVLNRRRLSLLVDLRLAPPRSDEAFEGAMAKHRPRIFADFVRIAVLVSSATGRLQLSRHVREDGLEVPVFQEEGPAIAHLALTPTTPPRPP